MSVLKTIVAGVLGSVVIAPAALATTTTFQYTGGEQSFRVPDGVTSIHVVAVGGLGGAGANGGLGGARGTATADLEVNPVQELLYVEVGGDGTTFNGGFNGGASSSPTALDGGGGGGGASDIRALPISLGETSLRSQLIVAGGGGGGAGGIAVDGGAGGGLTGSDGAYSLTCDPTVPNGGGGGATQTSGGKANGSGATAGALGVGGRGAAGGGGGGGGWYGGGGGYTCGGGGGGSGWFFAPETSNESFGTSLAPSPSVEISYTAHAPDPPEIYITVPGSPADDNTPHVTGNTLTGSTAHLFTNPGCSGPPVGSGGSETFASDGIEATVADNSTTTFYANASNSVGTSGCSSTSATYVEQSPPPDTRVDSAPPKTIKTNGKAKVRVIFSSDRSDATFKCRLDKRSFAPCSSPYRGKAGPGKHKFQVMAIAGGLADPSPAGAAFKVKSKKKR